MAADMTAAPLTIYRDTVRPEWVDYNGHLRDAFYMLIFSYATDALMDHIGLDEAARAQTGCSLYTLEAHVNYLREMKQGTPLQVTVQLLAHDAKRLQLYFALFAEGDPEPAAVSEQMLLHVDTRKPGSAPFQPPVWDRVQSLAAAQATLPRPAFAGRTIGLPARKS